jgi:hypothetical protein
VKIYEKLGVWYDVVAREDMVFEEIRTIKKYTSTLHWDHRRVALRVSQELGRPHLSCTQEYKRFYLILKDLALTRELWALCTRKSAEGSVFLCLTIQALRGYCKP